MYKGFIEIKNYMKIPSVHEEFKKEPERLIHYLIINNKINIPKIQKKRVSYLKEYYKKSRSTSKESIGGKDKNYRTQTDVHNEYDLIPRNVKETNSKNKLLNKRIYKSKIEKKSQTGIISKSILFIPQSKDSFQMSDHSENLSYKLFYPRTAITRAKEYDQFRRKKYTESHTLKKINSSYSSSSFYKSKIINLNLKFK